jgi:hypothetical protein
VNETSNKRRCIVDFYIDTWRIIYQSQLRCEVDLPSYPAVSVIVSSGSMNNKKQRSTTTSAAASAATAVETDQDKQPESLDDAICLLKYLPANAPPSIRKWTIWRQS